MTTHRIGNIDRRRALLQTGGAASLVAAAFGVTQARAAETGADDSLQRLRSSGVLRIGTPGTEPWFFKDQRSGEWHGVGWGVGLLLAQALGVKPEPVETTWSTAVAGLQADKFDVLLTMDATPERALAVDFPPQAMFYYAQAALVRDGLSVKSWEDMNKPDVRIAVVLGTSPDRDLSMRLTNAHIDRFPTADEAAAGFQAGRVDAISLFHPALVMLQSRLKRGTIVLPTPIRQSASSAAVRHNPDRAWCDWLGLALDYFYQTGQTQKVFEDYLAFRKIDAASVPGLVREQWSKQG